MRRFLTLCFQIAVIIGCGYFIVFINDLPDPSPTPSPAPSSSPARQQTPARTLPDTPHPARPHIRVSSAPVSSSRDGGIFSDRNSLHFIKILIFYGGFAGFALWVLVRTISGYRNGEGWTVFIPLFLIAFLVFAAKAWFGYFGDHGGFLIWPLVVAAVVIVFLLVRASAVDRQRMERADELRTFPAPPGSGGPASKKDFKDWL